LEIQLILVGKNFKTQLDQKVIKELLMEKNILILNQKKDGFFKC